MDREWDRAKWKRDWKKTKIGLTSTLYSMQRNNGKRSGRGIPDYGVLEFRGWCYSQGLFHKLYASWKDSGFKSELRPSADRVNCNKGYSFSNLQLMTWEDNKKKGLEECRVRKFRPVVGICDNGLEVKFDSIKDACLILGLFHSNICHAISGKYKKSGGLRWKYDN